MRHPLDGSKTLDELDPPAWGEPEFDSSLVKTCHRLRHKPIGELSVEDLRIMIGQGIGLRWLVPLAVEVLEHDPLAEGDFYPGDLLVSVLRVPREFWLGDWEWKERTQSLLNLLPELPTELTELVAAFRARTA